MRSSHLATAKPATAISTIGSGAQLSRAASDGCGPSNTS